MKAGLRLWSILLTISLILVPTAICGGLLYFYLRDELDNRRLISFMNFEQLAHRFDRSLEGFSRFSSESGALRFDREPIALFEKRGDTLSPVRGQTPEGFWTKGLLDSSCDLQLLTGQLYLLCPILLPDSLYQGEALKGGVYWAFWSLVRSDFSHFADVTPARVYLLDARGRALYQSDRPEPQDAILKKPLVQEFIRTPLTKSGSAPYTDSGTKVLGFAMHLSRSNATLFAESPASLVFAPLWRPSTWFLGALFFGVGFLVILARFFIMNLREQIQTLTNSFRDFALGMQIPTQHRHQDFFLDFGPMIDALNAGTHELKMKLEQSPGQTAQESVEKETKE